MLFDERNEFADNVSVAAAAGTAVIGDVIDLKPATTSPNTTIDLEGSEMYLVLQTGDEEIITAGAAGTLELLLVSDSLATLGAGVVADCTVHYRTGALVTDDAAVNDSRFNAGGLIYCGRLPSGSYERYLGILCTIATTTVTAGKINAFLTADPALYRAYADNVA
jgi:hypothetical protein